MPVVSATDCMIEGYLDGLTSSSLAFGPRASSMAASGTVTPAAATRPRQLRARRSGRRSSRRMSRAMHGTGSSCWRLAGVLRWSGSAPCATRATKRWRRQCMSGYWALWQSTTRVPGRPPMARRGPARPDQLEERWSPLRGGSVEGAGAPSVWLPRGTGAASQAVSAATTSS